MVATDFLEVALQNYSGYCARRPDELVLGKFFGCFQLRIKEVGLGQLTNVEQRAPKAFSYCLNDTQLLVKAGDRRIGFHYSCDVEILEIVLYRVILVGGGTSRNKA